MTSPSLAFPVTNSFGLWSLELEHHFEKPDTLKAETSRRGPESTWRGEGSRGDQPREPLLWCQAVEWSRSGPSRPDRRWTEYHWMTCETPQGTEGFPGWCLLEFMISKITDLIKWCLFKASKSWCGFLCLDIAGTPSSSILSPASQPNYWNTPPKREYLYINK